MPRMLLGLLLLGLDAAAAPSKPVAHHPLLPEPAAIRAQVDFWTRIYVGVTTRQGFVHDDRHLDVVYETLRFAERDTRRSRQRHVTSRKRHWRKVLENLSRRGEARTEDERRALGLLEAALGRRPSPRDLGAARHRLRFQLGQRDKFEAGLVRAGAYEDRMREILRGYGVPEDLAYLPHVESSFNTHAYSKYGAAGMWQFMRSTGRRYLRVDYVVDERLDPIEATHAAARLLRDNYADLGSWPLAITAYNHGAAGMKRARKTVGTTNIATIVHRYRGRAFRFASRNFYAQFLAARRVASSHHEHFPSLVRATPKTFDTIELPFYVDAARLERHVGLDSKMLAALNPSLRPAVFRGDKYIPKGFVLKLPARSIGADPVAWLHQIPAEHRHRAQRPSRTHVVRRGETLSYIARRHGTTVSTLVALNGLDDEHRIHPGQKLELLNAPRSRRSSRPEGTAVARLATGSEPATKRTTEPALARETRPPASTGHSGPSVVTTRRNATVAVATPVTALSSRTSATSGDEPAGYGPPRAAAAGLATTSLSYSEPMAALVDDPPWRRLEGDSTRVDHEETLAHLADWLDVSSRELRRRNRLSSRSRLRRGQRIELDFSRVSPETFQERRRTYHRAISKRFFAEHSVVGTADHVLASGENLWILSHRVYRLPPWLLDRYNPQAVHQRLAPGTRITIPVVGPTPRVGDLAVGETG